MLSKVLKFGSACAFGMVFLTGCGLFGGGEPPKQPYEPKKLEAQARGITVAKSTPYNCKILGEVEGKDNVGDRSGATRELLREGAINDLRNEASYVAGEGKRAMIAITKEEVKCIATVGKARQNVDCTKGLPNGATNGVLVSQRIHAQVFDCGEK